MPTGSKTINETAQSKKNTRHMFNGHRTATAAGLMCDERGALDRRVDAANQGGHPDTLVDCERCVRAKAKPIVSRSKSSEGSFINYVTRDKGWACGR